MNVIGTSVRGHHLTAELANDSPHVGEQVWSEFRGEERLAILGGEDDVSEQVGEGVGHLCRPSWARTILINLTAGPTARRRGLFSAAALRISKGNASPCASPYRGPTTADGGHPPTRKRHK